jgi:hypothetical protein
VLTGVVFLWPRTARADYEAIALVMGQIFLQMWAVAVAVALLTTVYRFGWALAIGSVLSAVASAASFAGLVEWTLNPSLRRNGDVRAVLPTTLAYLAFVWLAPVAEHLAFRWRRSGRNAAPLPPASHAR